MRWWGLFFLLLSSLAGLAGPIEVLPASKIEALRAGPCTFLHVWASWCSVCLEELPQLVRFVESEGKLRPLFLDISSPFVQENFSKRYIASLSPRFKTYVKPSTDDSGYGKAIDKKWTGALPYSAVYRFGKLKKSWIGALNTEVLRNELDALCK